MEAETLGNTNRCPSENPQRMSVENGSNAKLHKFDVSYIRAIYRGQAWGFCKVTTIAL
jgi:hypothetical protein